MLLATLALLIGLIGLVKSAQSFIEGSIAVAHRFAVPPLLIGMLIMGFGTSAPELAVSGLAAMDGNTGLALGNAFGSNIANITLILGVSALISPILVQSSILRRELPMLAGVTLLTILLLVDGYMSRADSLILLVVFAGLTTWSVHMARRGSADTLALSLNDTLHTHDTPLRTALLHLVGGLVFLLLSSQALVWGAVEIAEGLGVSQLVIGLTVVAIGTSLPELASSIIAARRGQDELALGNVIGSNLFNTLMVAGLAGFIHPTEVSSDLLQRDLPIMMALTFALFVIGYGRRGAGRINRYEAAGLVTCFAGYTGWLALSA